MWPFFNEYYQLELSNTLGMTSDTMARTWVFTKTFSADFVGRRLDHPSDPSSGLVRYGIESWDWGEQQQISDRTALKGHLGVFCTVFQAETKVILEFAYFEFTKEPISQNVRTVRPPLERLTSTPNHRNWNENATIHSTLCPVLTQ